MKQYKLTDTQKVVIEALAKGRLRVARAADIAYMSQSGILYHVEKIKRDFGLDPRDFYDCIKLLAMAEDGLTP